MEVWVCRCGLVDISKCEKRKRISNYFACQEITQTELGGNFSSQICDAKRFIEATVPALTAALGELGDMKAIVSWIRELRDKKKIFIFEADGRIGPRHIIVADDYPRPDDEGAL